MYEKSLSKESKMESGGIETKRYPPQQYDNMTYDYTIQNHHAESSNEQHT